MGTVARELCEHSKRRECTLHDVMHALGSVGAAPHPLELQHLAMDNRLAFPTQVQPFPAAAKAPITGSPRGSPPKGSPHPSPHASPKGSPAGFGTPGGGAAVANRGELSWRCDKDGKGNEQLSVPLFLPGLPPQFTFTGAPVFTSPYGDAGSLALPPVAAGGAAAAEQAAAAEPGTLQEQLVARLRPLLEPLVRQRGTTWEEALPLVISGGEAAALDTALCGADADATAHKLEALLSAVCPKAAQQQKAAASAGAKAGADGSFRATVASSVERETTPETQPELLDARSQKRKAKEQDNERRKSKRRIAVAADLTLSSTGGEEVIGRQAMVDAAEKAQSSAAAVVGMPLKQEPPVVAIELPPDGAEVGGAALAAAAAAAAAKEEAQQAAAAAPLLPVEDLPVAQRPMTPLMSSQLKTLLADLLNKGLPDVTENGQAAGIFDVDLSATVPHYIDIVPEPMDLGTMKRKLQRQEYPNAGEFEKDFRRLMVACSQYNVRTKEHPGYADGQYYLKLAAVLQVEFERRFENTMEDMEGELVRMREKDQRKARKSAKSDAAGAAGGGGIKLALGGAKAGKVKQHRQGVHKHAAFWRGDEGVARAIRSQVTQEEAEGKRIGGAGGRASRVDNILAQRHRGDAAGGEVKGASGGGAAGSSPGETGPASSQPQGAAGGPRASPQPGAGMGPLTRTASLGGTMS